jgi:hypothetical protein
MKHAELAGTNAFFRRSLADFRLAILHPLDTGLFCRRAIEGLMRSYMEEKQLGDGEVSRAWEELSAALRLDSSALKFIQRIGADARHAKLVTMTLEDLIKALSITRTTLQRFFLRATNQAHDPWDELTYP